MTNYIKLVAPTGAQITGTLDYNLCIDAMVGEVSMQDEVMRVGWLGGSIVSWDDQMTVRVGDQLIFVDEDGDRWRACDLMPEGSPMPESMPRPIGDLPDYNVLLAHYLAHGGKIVGVND